MSQKSLRMAVGTALAYLLVLTLQVAAGGPSGFASPTPPPIAEEAHTAVKATAQPYPDAQVLLTGYGKLGGVLTLFFKATKLKKSTVVNLSYRGCGHLLAHHRYTGLRGSKTLRLTHPLPHVPRTGTVTVVVSEPNHAVYRDTRPAGPIPHVHC